MKAPVTEGAPPGYLTVNEVLVALDMSRQNFYVSGLVEALPRWSVGGVLLFSRQDVGKLAAWLAHRRDRLAEGDRRFLRLAPAWVRDLDHAMDIIEAWEMRQEVEAALVLLEEE